MSSSGRLICARSCEGDSSLSSATRRSDTALSVRQSANERRVGNSEEEDERGAEKGVGNSEEEDERGAEKGVGNSEEEDDRGVGDFKKPFEDLAPI